MSYLPPGLPMWALGIVAILLAAGSLLRALSRLMPQNSRDRLQAWERWLEHRRMMRTRPADAQSSSPTGPPPRIR
ncbi:hypothetical protein LX90_003242 [Lentzea flava]|nr:hypothetical protein [Lentzea flava]